MYFISNTDGIPVLTENAGDEEITRKATREEIEIFNDFWSVYLDRVESGEQDSAELDETVRRATLTKHGLADKI